MTEITSSEPAKLRNEHGEAIRTRPTTVMNRSVAVLQDMFWPENVAAAMLSDRFTDIEVFREAITDQVFAQPSPQTRNRYASYFIKWFLPSVTFAEPTAQCWRAFHDRAALEHVMRWQFISSNPLIAGFVDGRLTYVAPGEPVDDLVDMYLAEQSGQINDKSRNRMKANLRKVGLLLLQDRRHYRIIPEVSTKAVAILLASLFAPQAQVVSLDRLVSDPWWKRLGLTDEAALRAKLLETVKDGLISRSLKMDTLDQITTRYSLEQFVAGEVRTK